MEMNQIGSWAFIIGVLIAIIGGAVGGSIIALSPWITTVLVILGLVVGLLNITQEEFSDFLIAVIALAVVSVGTTAAQLSAIPGIGMVLQSIVTNITVFVAPAGLVVALTTIYKLAKSPSA